MKNKIKQAIKDFTFILLILALLHNGTGANLILSSKALTPEIIAISAAVKREE